MAITVVPYRAFKTRKLDETAVLPMAAGTIAVPEGSAGVASRLVYSNVKVILVTSAYTPDVVNHIWKSSITNEVATGGGYTVGGQALAGKVVGYDVAGDFAYFDANDVVWAAPCTFTARRAILFFDTGTSTTSPLIGYVDFGANIVGTGGVIALRWAAPAAGGILRLK